MHKKKRGDNSGKKTGQSKGWSVKLSNSKARKIERAFNRKVDETRSVYLAEELSKYNNIKVEHD